MATTSLEFRLLGPIEVWSDGRRLPLTGLKQRAILAILLLHANEIVPRERLLAEVWGEKAPESGHSLDVHISRLRKTLQSARNGDEILVRRGRGYLLRVERNAIDFERFRQLAGAGEEAAAAGRTAQSADLLGEALKLWRGSALADVVDADVGRPEVAWLEELRLAAVEQRIDAELTLGRHARLVGELEALVRAHPLRERFCAQLMLALYRGGRQAEALAMYAGARALLIEELGLEPSEDLRVLQRRILAQDPALRAATAREAAASTGLVDAEVRAAVMRRPRLTRRPLLFLVSVVALTAVTISVIVAFAGGSHPPPLEPGSGSVAFLDARSGKLLGRVSDGFGGGGMVRFGAGWIWEKRESGILFRIDPHTRRVTRSIALGNTVGEFAVGDGAVWMIDADSPTLLRIDPRYGVVSRRIPLSHAANPGLGAITESAGVSLGAGSVWVAHGLAQLERVDPASGRVVHRFPLADASLVAFGDGAVWAASSDLGKLTKIDPQTNAIVTTAHVRPWICCLAVGGGYVWAATDDGVWKVSSDGEPLAKISLRSGVGNIAYGDGALWVTSGAVVLRIDPQTNAAKLYQLGHMLTGIGIAGRMVAVSMSPSGSDLLANLGGKVLRIRLSQDWLDDTDPAVAAAPGTNEWPWLQQLLFATSARLLTYGDAPAPAGWRLVPEVAAALPAVSSDGRTYTFRIRPGFRFSPPSNQPVTSETFKYSIERALSPKLGQNAPAVSVASDVAGVHAFQTGKAPHISGIRASASDLSITLVRPAPDFPERIALSYFSAVPVGTPVVRNGLREPIPSAGPYYVSGNDGATIAVLRRNPNYHGVRPHRLDAVVFTREDLQMGDAVAAVAAGKADYIAEPGPPLAAATSLARRYGEKVEGPLRRYFLMSMLATDELVFDTRHGLFNDARLRRAVNFALDRPALATSFGDLVTDRALPPGIPGFQSRHVFPLTGPRLREARALAAARGGRAVLAVCSEQACLAIGRIIAADLERIGIHIALRQYDGAIASKRHRRGADMVLARVYAPYPDPVAALRAALGGAFRHRLDSLAVLDRARRLTAAERLELNILKREAPIAAFGNPTIPEFFSARVGCKTFQPLFFGVDLSSLCIRGE